MQKTTAPTVEGMIVDAVRQASGNFSVPLSSNAVKEAAQVVINQTNNEPWFQSKITLFSIGGVITAFLGIVAMFAGQAEFDPVLLGTHITTIATFAGVLWGRWAARKPLGTVK